MMSILDDRRRSSRMLHGAAAMNETLRAMIESGAVTLEDLVEAINGHEGRATAARDVIVAARCELCGRGFPQQPQDSRLASAHGHRVICYRTPCRRELRRLQNVETRSRRRKPPTAR
jgi:hypothetical protein